MNARRLLVVLLCGALLPSTSIAQEPARTAVSIAADSVAQDSSGSAPANYAVEASLVNVNVLVADEDGRVISGLKQENFRVLDNGVPQQIASFSPATAPITIVLLLEYSSIGYHYFASKAVTWSTGFLDKLEPQDWVALVTYDLNSTVRVDFTRNRAEVRDGLGSLSFPGFKEANLFDAVIETLDKLEPVKGRKSILLLSTGANTFGIATFDDLLKRLKTTDVTIFSVGLAEEEYTRSLNANIGYLQARSSLATMAGQTGGISFFPRFTGELPDIFESVTGFLRNEYTLSFSPRRELRDGKFHKLTVQVLTPDGKRLTVRDEKGRERKLKVFARSGYVAPALPMTQTSATSNQPRTLDRP